MFFREYTRTLSAVIALHTSRLTVEGDERPTAADADPVAAIVSESLGLFFWPGEDPLGKRLDNRTVVGVAGSARQGALQDPDAVEAYFPIEPGNLPAMAVVVRTSSPPEGALRSVASMARALDPDVFPEVQLLKASFEQKLRQTELTALSVSLLGFSALLLACVGVVGLVAYSVAQRTKEIGIRMALGATGSRVLSVVLRQLSRPVAAGLLLGIGAAAALSQILRRGAVRHQQPGSGRIRGCHRRVRRGRRARSPVAREPCASRRSPARASVRLMNP